MKKLTIVLFLAFISLSAEDEIKNPKNIEEKIDNLLNEIVSPKSCTVQREELCKVLIGFQNANGDLPEKINKFFTVGRFFSAHLTFRQTWEYGRNWFVIFFKNKNSILSFNMYKVESESDQEIDDTKALISQLEKGSVDKENSLFKFLSDLDKGIALTECEKFVRTYQCKGNKDQFNEMIYVRFTEESIYVLTFGRVSKMEESWDKVPGIFFSRLPIPKKLN